MNSYDIDRQLEPILRQMEKNGVRLDVGFLEKLSQRIGLRLLKLEAEIYHAVGHEFNINSPSQLAEILYQELKIEPAKSGIRRRKTHHSTSAQDLRKIKNLHPLINLILEYRELAKLTNTYLDPLPRLVDEKGRLHTNYAVDTATGRLSSKNPNLQNIPTKTDLGNEVRKAFVAEKNHKLLVADYSQIELRIAAHLSGDPTMIGVFQQGQDIHKATAVELGVDRRTAKVINFGILYGMSAYGVSETLEIPAEEGQILIDKYFMAYPRLAYYIQELIKEAAEDGFVQTLFGRKRYIPELRSPIERVRRFGQRVAVNSPIQGTAADIIKLAMIQINQKLKTKNQKHKLKIQQDVDSQTLTQNSYSKLILQVHDELVFEVPEEEIQPAAQMVRETMEGVVKLKVPLVVNLFIGQNWVELEELKV